MGHVATEEDTALKPACSIEKLLAVGVVRTGAWELSTLTKPNHCGDTDPNTSPNHKFITINYRPSK